MRRGSEHGLHGLHGFDSENAGVRLLRPWCIRGLNTDCTDSFYEDVDIPWVRHEVA